MKFIIEREQLLKPLQQVSNPVSGRPILPILGNILIQVNEKTLSLTSTDLEVEMLTKVKLTQPTENGSITVPARKLFNIWRGLPDGSEIKVTTKREGRLLVCSGRSRFSLLTLPASDFPNLHNWHSKVELQLTQIAIKNLIEATQFSMAHQDVRHYLNGMLFETEGQELRTVATDGHRLAICSLNLSKNLPNHSAIVPRKGVLEFMRLLGNNDELLKLQIGNNNIRAYIGNYIFTSKLIDGRFPDYRRVLPKSADKILTADCNNLRQALLRAAILSNDKIRGVRFHISKNQLIITANNPEQEESEEIIDIDYQNQTIEISFNVNYILDILNALKCQQVNLLLTDSNSSVQIKGIANNSSNYVVMPMRL